MIESCTKKRMVCAVTCLGGLTLFVLIIESHLTSSSSVNHSNPVTRNSTNDCWLKEDYEIVESCHPCSAFEIRSKMIPACLPTHYKEVLKCINSGSNVIRSCDKVTWLEERNFWIFEGLAFATGFVSTSVVYVRQKILDHRMLRRIQRQLASGV